MARETSLTGVERTFDENEIIVSKTDVKGRITYANRTFMKVSQYSEAELLGKAHCIVRHPDMPRCVFKYLWDTIGTGHEVFAYVVNRCKGGDHYWVFAHVTPTFDARGRIVSYHSSRRKPTREAVSTVQKVYAELLREERRHRTPREQWEASMPLLLKFLQERGVSYDEWVFSLARAA